MSAVGGAFVLTGSADPTAGVGVAATAPALYIRTGTAQIWLKTGAGNTAWTLVVQTGAAAQLGAVTLAAGAHLAMGTGGQVKIDPGTSALPGLVSTAANAQGIYMPAPGDVAIMAGTLIAGVPGDTRLGVGNGYVALGSTGTKTFVDGAIAERNDAAVALGATNPNLAISAASKVRATSTAAATITGIAGGEDGRSLSWLNASAFDHTFAAEDVLSDIANRIATAKTIAAGTRVTLEYDAVSSRWRVG